LAFTGSETQGLALVGGLLILVGAHIVFFARRASRFSMGE